MKLRHLILCLLAWFVVSCASNSSKKPPTTTAIKPFSQRIDENNGYKQDAEGNWKIKTNKRSSFEGQGANAQFKGDYAKKDYKTTDYSKKSWWGNKNYQAKAYAGSTDGSRFQKTSRLDGKGAPEAGKDAGMTETYKTGDYATSAAREAGKKPVKKPSDAETDVRRKVYPVPEIIDWRQQRSLSIDQSKGILGH